MNFLDIFSKNTQTSNFIKIRRSVPRGGTDGHDDAKRLLSQVAYEGFLVKAPSKATNDVWQLLRPACLPQAFGLVRQLPEEHHVHLQLCVAEQRKVNYPFDKHELMWALKQAANHGRKFTYQTTNKPAQRHKVRCNCYSRLQTDSKCCICYIVTLFIPCIFTELKYSCITPTNAPFRYSHAPHTDVSVEGPHIRRWSHKITV